MFTPFPIILYLAFKQTDTKNMASIAKILRLDKVNKKGEAPIYFRIIKHRKVRYIATGVRLEKKYWNKSKEVVRSTHTNHKRLNSYLTNKFAELQDKVFEHETISKSLDTGKLKGLILGKAPTEFLPYAHKDLAILWKAGKVGTHDKRKSIINKLTAYMAGKKLYFQSIDSTFLFKYEKYLREHHGNKTNTVHRDLKYIRTMFNNAIREDLIDPSITPFLKYKLKTEKAHRQYLTEDELKLVEKYKAPKYSKIDMHRDMFVFASNAGGLRISDILLLSHSSIEKNHLHISIRKTGSQLSLQIPKVAMAIIKKWKSAPGASKRFVFPILPDGYNKLDLSTENKKLLDNRISSATVAVNKSLKVIALEVGIKKNVSTHIARHTWATRALQKGITIDKVSKLMGHSQLRETQIYAKIMSGELYKAMDVFDE